MAFVTTTSTSWLGRVGSSAMGTVIGLILVLATIVGLFWNEGRAVKTARALAEGAGAVITVDNNSVDPANEGKLVHMYGPVVAKGALEDALVAVKADGAVALNRKVEMLQWKETDRTETEKSLSGTETTKHTYTYSKEWSTSRINSGSFKESGHDNPEFPIQNESFTVPTIDVGAFEVAGANVSYYGSKRPIQPDSASEQKLKQTLGTLSPVSRVGDVLVVGNNPQAPSVGDLRVSFSRTDLKDVSVAGLQRGKLITDWTASNGNTVFLAQAGNASSQELFADAISLNNIMTWVIRAVALFVMFVGFCLMLSIFSAIADIIPFVGSIVSAGTMLLALAMTFLVGTLTIAAGWMFYRPLLALALVAIGALVFFAIAKLGKSRAAAQSAPQAVAT